MSDGLKGTVGALSTPFKFLILMSLALLPIGALLTYSAVREVHEAQQAIEGQATSRMLSAGRSIEGLIARNALALRVAANGAFVAGNGDPCAAARNSLEITPAVARQFTLIDNDGTAICGDLEIDPLRQREPVEAGNIDLWVDRDQRGVMLRVGVADGTATGRIETAELVEAAEAASAALSTFSIVDASDRALDIVERSGSRPERVSTRRETIELAGGRLRADAAVDIPQITTSDRLLIFLPVLMFAAAVLMSWLLVNYLLIRPLRRLRSAVTGYDPDEGDFALPERLGPANEIKQLGRSFRDAVHRIEESEEGMSEALEGQRRLVREVHHRVKNNLQVVASLLNIHSRGAEGEEARSAYTGIGRRVEALAVVHRNHFAEVEESRGIQLRPLLTELAASLRASAGEGQGAPIDLDLVTASTTQDVAVAVAFLVTEVVEYVIDNGSGELIEISLNQSSEITARLSIASQALVQRDDGSGGSRVQFERIVDGLARQLRSPLDKKVGSYSVEIPIFPDE